MADAQADFGTKIPAKLAALGDSAKSIGAVFLVKITGDGGGTWTIDCKNTIGVRAAEEPADVTIELSKESWETLSTNPSSAMMLYTTGKLKIAGNAMLATKLQQIL